ncbi:hypothetical protein BT69DRAFT_1289338 [Atractiella rhizophila]|nr:hypothetical protein BT69DRAFT_1289338 [Atractiella rhizophila]
MSLDLSHPSLSLRFLPQSFFIYRFPASSPLPKEVQINLLSPFGPTGKTNPSSTSTSQPLFLSVTRTEKELSIVTDSDSLLVTEGLEKEGPYSGFLITGPLELSMTGVMATLLQPLKKDGLSIFAISTFDTDYILVKEKEKEKVKESLGQAGWKWA